MKKKSNLKLALFLTAVCVCASWNGPSFAQQLLTSDSEKIDFAQGLLGQTQYQLAAAQFEEFIQQFPNSTFLPDAYLGAGECYFFLNQYDKAIEAFQKYLAQFPDGKSKGIAQVRLGQSFYLKNSFDEALSQFNAVAVESLSHPFQQTLYFFKGQILASKNNTDEAIASFKAAAEMSEATAYTAQAYFKWGSLIAHTDYQGALEKYAKALETADTDDLKAAINLKQGEAYFLLKQYDDAAATFRKTIDTYPGLAVVPDALANWYQVLIIQKKYDAVIADFNEKWHGMVDKAEYQPAYLLVSKAFSAAGNTDLALTILDKITALAGISEQQKAVVALQKGKVLFENGKFADAVAFIDGHLSADASVKASMLLLKSKSLLSLKDYDKAWAAYEEVSKEFVDSPVMAEALCGMAYVRYGQEQYEPAAILFMDCFNKSQDEPLRRDAIYNAFVTYKKAGNEDKTIEVAEHYLKLTPPGDHLVDVAIALSTLYTKRQAYDKATELLTPFQNDPDESHRRTAAFQMAYNLQLSGKLDEALAAYEKLISEAKNDKLTYLAHKNSFMIYLQNKDDDKAADVMQKAVQSFEDNDFSLKSYVWLAEHWQSKNDAPKMLDVLNIAEKRFAQDPDALSVKFYMGQAFRMQDDCKKAMELYDAVIAGDQGVYKGRARLGKGVCLTGLGDYEGAKKELEQAVVDSPDDAFVAMRARFALAHNAELLKDFDMAAKLYLVVDVLYKDPEYAPKALARAGAIFEEQLNNKKEALNAYTKIVQVYPDSPEVAKAQEKIAQLK